MIDFELWVCVSVKHLHKEVGGATHAPSDMPSTLGIPVFTCTECQPVRHGM